MHYSTGEKVSYGPQNMAIQKILPSNYYCIRHVYTVP